MYRRVGRVGAGVRVRVGVSVVEFLLNTTQLSEVVEPYVNLAASLVFFFNARRICNAHE